MSNIAERVKKIVVEHLGVDEAKVMKDVLKACRKVEPDCEIYL